MIGAQTSQEQLEKIKSYLALGKKEGAELLCGGSVNKFEVIIFIYKTNCVQGDLAGGYYVQPTIFKGNNKMRIFQEEIFGKYRIHFIY